jgi:outer membrane protein, multidrug efflux system
MPSRPTLLALIAASALVSACQTGDRIEPNITLPAAFEAPATPAGMAPAPLDAWWTGFNDPALNALIETALAASPDARAATARIEQAIATRRSLRNQAVFPEGQIVGSARRGDSEVDGLSIPGFSSSGENENYSANFDVSWELDLFGRRGAALRIINADLIAARFEAEAARASLAANVAQSYFQLRALDVQIENARETSRVQGSLTRLATRRAELGLGAGADADRVAGDLAQAEAQLAALEAQLQAAQRSLLILIGRGSDPIASLTLPPREVVVPAPPATTPGDLLTRRPDVREAAARLISATNQLTISERAIFPTFNLTPGAGISRTVQPAFESTTKSWSLGVGVTVPVLNIPTLLAEMDAQGARADQAALAYEKAVQTAYGEAESALVQLEADRRRVALLTDGEARARRAYNAADRRYRDGVDDLTQALSAEQAWRATRAALTTAQADAQNRAVQTFKALGGGWTPMTDQQARTLAVAKTEPTP